MSKLEKVSPALVTLIQPAVDEVKRTVQYANAAGVARTIYFHPLMLGSHHTHFKDGVLVEMVRRGKRQDVLAAGGRYVTFFNFGPKYRFSIILGIGTTT
jgi:translation initiation factor 2-alpha kinase 4